MADGLDPPALEALAQMTMAIEEEYEQKLRDMQKDKAQALVAARGKAAAIAQRVKQLVDKFNPMVSPQIMLQDLRELKELGALGALQDIINTQGYNVSFTHS